MKKISITTILIILALYTFGQSVTDVCASVQNDKIRIDYTIKNLKFYQKITDIKVFISKNGEDFTGPLEKITSESYSTLRNGTHTIIWDALNEMYFTTEELVFDVQITVDNAEIERNLFITLTGNDITPLGLRFGQLGKTGWYVEARASFYAFRKAEYSYDGTNINEYNDFGHYNFTGKGGWKSYCLVAGLTQQFAENGYFYAGLGYGVENYIMETKLYQGNNEVKTTWTKYDEYCVDGIEIDAGILFKHKKFLFGAGGTSLNFKSFGWSLSFGMVL